MIDGWGKPPKRPWLNLRDEIQDMLWSLGHACTAVMIDRDKIKLGDLLATPGEIIQIGYSLGGSKAAQLTRDFRKSVAKKIRACAVVDGVDPKWDRAPLICEAEFNAGFRRLYKDRGRWQVLTPWSPPSLDIIGGLNSYFDASHTGIIEVATPAVIEFVRKAVIQ